MENTPDKSPDKMDKRDALIVAAREAFRRDGFAAARIGDIATAAQVGKGTVYEYFPSKEALLLACCLDQCANDREGIRTALAHLPTLAAAIPGEQAKDGTPPVTLADPKQALSALLTTGLTHLLNESCDNCRLFLELFALARRHPELRADMQPAILQVLEQWEHLLHGLITAGIAAQQFRPHPDVPGLCRLFTATVDGLMLQRQWRDDDGAEALARRTAETFLACLEP